MPMAERPPATDSELRPDCEIARFGREVLPRGRGRWEPGACDSSPLLSLFLQRAPFSPSTPVVVFRLCQAHHVRVADARSQRECKYRIVVDRRGTPVR